MLGALWVGSGTQILLEHLPCSPPPLPLQGPASQICLERFVDRALAWGRRPKP